VIITTPGPLDEKAVAMAVKEQKVLQLEEQQQQQQKLQIQQQQKEHQLVQQQQLQKAKTAKKRKPGRKHFTTEELGKKLFII
jgi:hypothetical protein